MEEEEGMRARSFRKEDYNTRRVFLRSYPLQWEDTDDGGTSDGRVDQEEEHNKGGDDGGGGDHGGKGGKAKLDSLKQRVVVAVFRWGGGKVLLLRKLKNKVTFYLFACQPFGFNKPSTNHLLTA